MGTRKKNTVLMVILVVITVMFALLSTFGLSLGINKIVPMRSELKKSFELGGGRYVEYKIAEGTGTAVPNAIPAVEQGYHMDGEVIHTDDNRSINPGDEGYDGIIAGEIDPMTMAPISDAVPVADENATPAVADTRSDEEKSADMEKVVEIMQSRWDVEPYKGVKIYKLGSDGIRVDIPRNVGLGAGTAEDVFNSVIANMGTQGVFGLYDDTGELVFDATSIDNYNLVDLVALGGSGVGIQLNLNEEGKAALAEATKEVVKEDAADTPVDAATEASEEDAEDAEDEPRVFSFKLDDTEIAPAQISGQDTTGSIIIQNQLDAFTAARVASFIDADAMPVSLELANIYNVPGISSLTIDDILLFVLVGCAIAIVLMLAVYKFGGVWGALSLIIGLLILQFGYATIDGALFTYSGLFGAIASMVYMIGYIVLILEDVRKSSTLGSSPYIAAKSSLKNTITTMLTFTLPAMVAAAISKLFGGAALDEFAFMFLVGCGFAIATYFIAYGVVRLGTSMVDDPSKYASKSLDVVEK